MDPEFIKWGIHRQIDAIWYYMLHFFGKSDWKYSILTSQLFNFLPQKWSQSRASGIEYSLSSSPSLHYYPLDPQNAMLFVRLKSSGWESQRSPSVPLLNQLEKSLLNDVKHPLPYPLCAESSLGSLVQQCLMLGKHLYFLSTVYRNNRDGHCLAHIFFQAHILISASPFKMANLYTSKVILLFHNKGC